MIADDNTETGRSLGIPSEWLHRLSHHKHKDARRLAQHLGRYERSDHAYRSALRPIMLRQIDELAAELSDHQ